MAAVESMYGGVDPDGVGGRMLYGLYSGVGRWHEDNRGRGRVAGSILQTFAKWRETGHWSFAARFPTMSASGISVRRAGSDERPSGACGYRPLSSASPFPPRAQGYFFDYRPR